MWSLISRLGFLRKCKGRMSVSAHKISQSVYLVVSYIGGPPVPYNYETSEMAPTSLISRLGFLRKCKGRMSVSAWTHNSWCLLCPAAEVLCGTVCVRVCVCV
jgi:hypothetical protein